MSRIPNPLLVICQDLAKIEDSDSDDLGPLVEPMRALGYVLNNMDRDAKAYETMVKMYIALNGAFYKAMLQSPQQTAPWIVAARMRRILEPVTLDIEQALNNP